MFQEATTLSSLIIEQLVDKNAKTNEHNCELGDMLESAAMILVQSYKALGRTSEILKQLKVLFGSVTAIPAQVFLTGVCLQLPDSPPAKVQETLEEFLIKWRYVDGKYYTVASMEDDVPYMEEFSNQISLGVDKYLEIIELYVITFLRRILENFDPTISWVEKSPLLEEKRQDLLRRLHSMNTLKLGSSSQSSALPLQIDECTTDSISLIEKKSCNGTTNIWNTKINLRERTLRNNQFWSFLDGELHFGGFVQPLFGSSHLVLSNGRIFLGFLVALVYYISQRKQASLWSVVKRQASSMKKALVDYWQLAFSYQVNPLAAVQQFPSATRGSR